MNRVSDAQDNLIDYLKKQISFFEAQERKTEKSIDEEKLKGEFYFYIQKRILEDPIAMEAWKNFIFVCKLASEKTIKGITE